MSLTLDPDAASPVDLPDEIRTRFTHRRDPGCTGTDYVMTTDAISTLVWCTTCKSWLTLRYGSPWATLLGIERPDPQEQLGQGPARWWCRDHDHPVTWRGTGCPGCEQDHRDRLRRLAAQRADRMAARQQATQRHH